MNRFFIAAAVAVVLGALGPRAFAQSNAGGHRVVLEMTSDDPKIWETTLNNVENVKKALGAATIEVIAHGGGLAMLTRAKNEAVRERMKLAANEGVVFAACENTMRRQKVKKEDLVDLAKTVDSGVAELVRKQEAGWSYIRIGG